jgi:hypothetical protein
MIRDLRRAATLLRLAIPPVFPAAAQLPSSAHHRARAVTRTAVYCVVSALEGASRGSALPPVAFRGALVAIGEEAMAAELVTRFGLGPRP